MSTDQRGPAGRFLHVCYSCADAEQVADCYVDAFGMRPTMATPMEPSDGALLGLEGEIVANAVFVYDHRGGRVSPAIEIQGWARPAVTGTPVNDATLAGMQAVGFAVADLAINVDRLIGRGFRQVAGGETNVYGAPSATLLDPFGALVDLVEDTAQQPDAARLRHLRIGCRSIADSIAWYQGLGFDTVGAVAPVADPAAFGLAEVSTGTFARLALPEEPFEVVLVQWGWPEIHGRHVEVANHAGWYRTALRVDDTRAAYDEMSAAGWSFARPPQLIELHGTPVPEMWICFLDDPDGVPFEFVQRAASAFKR